MKKTILLLALALTAGNFVTSCSNRDEDPVVVAPKYNIVGKWNAKQYQDTDGSWKDMSILKWYSQFNADGSYKSYSGNTYTGTYVYDNNSTVTATVGSEKIIYTIKSMSGSEAVAEMYYASDPSDKVNYKLTKE